MIGSMYGLTSIRGHYHYPVRKPWRIAYINSTISQYLNSRCDGSHVHVPCSGPDAVYSQGYTPAICEAIHRSVMDGRGHRTRWRGLERRTVNFARVSILAAFDVPSALGPKAYCAMSEATSSGPAEAKR
ncbi:MAG: hypothetical protein ACKPKO_19670, partial [Candidatus Fonsibacter sp.]